MNEFNMGSTIMNEKFLEGKALCEKYVCGTIPPDEVAKFLGIGTETFRCAVQQNQFPFATPYKVGMSDQSRCIIPALRFWDWLNCRL